jgi:hypothetical protein
MEGIPSEENQDECQELNAYLKVVQQRAQVYVSTPKW